MPARFLTLDQVAEELAITEAQTYSLLRTGDLPAIKIGGRGQWRIERSRLEEFIDRLYADTERFVREHPWPSQPGGSPGAPGPDEPDEG